MKGLEARHGTTNDPAEEGASFAWVVAMRGRLADTYGVLFASNSWSRENNGREGEGVKEETDEGVHAALMSSELGVINVWNGEGHHSGYVHLMESKRNGVGS